MKTQDETKMIDISKMPSRQYKLVKPYEMIGKRFDKLVVLGLDSLRGNRNVAYYLCKCDCGNEVVISGSTLRKKTRHSCHDCKMRFIHNLQTTHHQTNTALYRIYQSMKNRCYLKSHKAYQSYGGRGIKVCDEWLGKDGFINFYNWAIANGWKEIKTSKNYSKLSIDRIDTNGIYEPSNCRFVSMKQQQNNKRNNHLIEYKGEKKNITQWCEKFGLNRNTIYGQINYQNLTLEQILERRKRQ